VKLLDPVAPATACTSVERFRVASKAASFEFQNSNRSFGLVVVIEAKVLVFDKIAVVTAEPSSVVLALSIDKILILKT
jgi:hypothetical protein